MLQIDPLFLFQLDLLSSLCGVSAKITFWYTEQYLNRWDWNIWQVYYISQQYPNLLDWTRIREFRIFQTMEKLNPLMEYRCTSFHLNSIEMESVSKRCRQKRIGLNIHRDEGYISIVRTRFHSSFFWLRPDFCGTFEELALEIVYILPLVFNMWKTSAIWPHQIILFSLFFVLVAIFARCEYQYIFGPESSQPPIYLHSTWHKSGRY